MLLLTCLVWAGCGSASVDPAAPTTQTPAVVSRVTAQATQTVNLSAGWNAVSFQGMPLQQLSAPPAVAGFVFWDGTSYQLNSLTLANANAGDGANRGFWVFATAATSMTYTATDVSGTSFNLRAGWNLVGFPARQLTSGASIVTRRDGAAVPIESVLLPGFYQLNPDGTTSLVEMNRGGTITPGRPYWVFASAPVNISWGVVSPQPSPTASARLT